MSLTFADYQQYAAQFMVNRAFIGEQMATRQALVIEALGVHAERYMWQAELPVYPVMTTAEKNGGWGQLMPFWFKPQDRPIPYYTLDNWALFALTYAHSFGPSAEAQALVERFFTVETVTQVVVGTNLQLPFLPTTQGRGRFLRNGMLPFLLAILWLEDETRQAWLRLHQLGAAHFIEAQDLAACANPIDRLTELEYAIFSHIEHNEVLSEEAVAQFLDDNLTNSTETPSLVSLYQALFGGIGLGITALANEYRDKPLTAWREWILTEITMPYRMPDYGIEAIKTLINDY